MGKSVRRKSIFILFGAIYVCCTLTPAFAHKVTVFAWQEGDRVFTESRFSAGKWVKNGHIDVYDGLGKKLLEGKTDDQGLFSFKHPGGASLDIVLKAGAGHQARWQITNDEKLKDTQNSRAYKESNAKPEKLVTLEGVHVNTHELEAVVERVLDKKLKPVIAMMRDQQNTDPSMTDIIGGIGYIVGLTGVAAWFSARKRKGRQDNE